jgi:hypothetical protein
MKRTDVLQLNLKREFFDSIVRRKKPFEYRTYKPYWKSRLEGRDYKAINLETAIAQTRLKCLLSSVVLVAMENRAMQITRSSWGAFSS